MAKGWKGKAKEAMISPVGRLKGKGKAFHEQVFEMRHVVFSVIRERQVPEGKAARALGTGFFIAPRVFITCDHVVNPVNDRHQPGDSYLLVANLTGRSGKLYRIERPELSKDINLFPNLDLAVLRVRSADANQPYCALEYGDYGKAKESESLVIRLRNFARLTETLLSMQFYTELQEAA